MADAEQVRLVRCPKCENLLPELPDYSVYQCGGCGAVLRAKSKMHGSDFLSFKSDDERTVAISEKSEDTPEKVVATLCTDPASDIKSNVGSLSFDRRVSDGNGCEFSEPLTYDSKDTTDKLATQNGHKQHDNGNGLSGENREYGSHTDFTNGSQRPGKMFDQPSREIGERYRRNLYSDFHGVRLSTSKYPDEGPSNFHRDSYHSREAPFRKYDNLDEPNKVNYLENDRAELLRKLEDLKDQLARSCSVVDKAKDSLPLNGRTVAPESYTSPNACFTIGSSDLNRSPSESFHPYRHSAGLSYLSHHHDAFPYNDQPDIMHGFCPSSHFPGYKEKNYTSHVHRTTPGEYYRPHPHAFFQRQCVDANCDAFGPYDNSTLHQPTCPCLHCHDSHAEVSASVPPSVLYQKKFPDVLPNNSLYHCEDPFSFGYHFPHPRSAIPPYNSHRVQFHNRHRSDLTTEIGGSVPRQPARVVLAGGGRRCHPLAGGAPFVACHNCFELLQLPKKVCLTAKKQQKVRCGACSTMIKFTVLNKKFVFSTHTGAKEADADYENNSCEVVKGRHMHSRGSVNRDSINFSSDDFDNAAYEFLSMDRKRAPLAECCNNLSLDNSQEMEGLHSTSSSLSDDDEHSSGGLIGSKESVQQGTDVTRSPPPPGSPLQQHFNHSSGNHGPNRFGKGNRSSRSDHEKVLTSKAILRQNSLQEASLATEMEVSFNECSDTAVSQDSGDANREHDQARSNKGNESSLFNIIKKSFKDLSRSNQNDEHARAKVSVNGHLISDRLIRKAEKLAGPIQPGKYWYDFRAGFWGVMGGPCLGIIPPFIEEFNYPMPGNCAGGNTGVFVNGRELHQKDLDLLASRGLLASRDRSYIIEISGRLWDEETGEELDGLGKLAPTVEKVKHGFGMKVPKAAADY